MRKSSNAETDVIKKRWLQKTVYSVDTYNESVFNPFFVSSWTWSCFYVNREKISFPRPDFVDPEIAIWGITSLTDFYKRIHLSFKKRHVLDCQRKISFVEITHLKFKFLTPHNIKSYLVANQLQDSTFISDINRY